MYNETTGCLKKLLKSGEQFIDVSPSSSVFLFRSLTRSGINAARIGFVQVLQLR